MDVMGMVVNDLQSEVDKLQKIWEEKYKKVMEQREEILTAFIAKYGCEPDQIIQVEWRKTSFITEWSVKLKEKE